MARRVAFAATANLCIWGHVADPRLIDVFNWSARNKMDMVRRKT